MISMPTIKENLTNWLRHIIALWYISSLIYILWFFLIVPFNLISYQSLTILFDISTVIVFVDIFSLVYLAVFYWFRWALQYYNKRN